MSPGEAAPSGSGTASTPLVLAGKRVLVTGASSGIGAAIARELAAAGAIVGLCARRQSLLDAVLDDCARSSPQSRAWSMDLSDLDGIGAFAHRVTDELGPLDVVVNNAGVIGRGRLPDVRWEDVEALNRINYLSPVKLTLAVLPGMIERGGGHIVNISSVAARLCPPTEAAYGATKAALTAFFEAAAADLWDTGVRIHNVYPGLIRVNDDPPDAMHEGVAELPATDVAEAVRRQLEEGSFEVYVPEEFGPLYAHRAADVAGFVAGSAAWARQQLGPVPSGSQRRGTEPSRP